MPEGDGAIPKPRDAEVADNAMPSTAEPGFGPGQLRVMGFAAVILTVGLILFLFLNGHRLETQTARALICLLVSLLLGIFFFVWWPRQYELDRIPIINLPVRVTGPIVVWLVIFVLLLQVMPREDAPARVYTLVNAPSGVIRYHPEIKVVRKDGREPEFELIEDRNSAGNLGKILIKFEPGEDALVAELRIPLHKPLSITFLRSESTVDVSKLEYVGD